MRIRLGKVRVKLFDDHARFVTGDVEPVADAHRAVAAIDAEGVRPNPAGAFGENVAIPVLDRDHDLSVLGPHFVDTHNVEPQVVTLIVLEKCRQPTKLVENW